MKKNGWQALSPLAVFLLLYLVTSLIVNDFYAVPITVAFVAASVYAVAITTGMPLKERVEEFSRGAANANILQMIWIFVLAGAFATSAASIGAIDATVGLSLAVMPERLVPAGLFVGACFISLSVGTSVGTIVALAPVAAGIAEATHGNVAFITAIVVGGAFFGDNLSFISDTTIAATRTQGCQMLDKFRANARIVVPAAIAVLVFYVFYGLEEGAKDVIETDVNYILILPYLAVLATALGGMNVMAVLVIGIVTVGIVGLATGSCTLFGWFGSMGEGMVGMGELIIVTLLAGGMLQLIRVGGGIDLVLNAMTRHIRGRRGAELAIVGLVSLANVCTANNTIAILTVGGLSADIAKKYDVNPKRSASILDTFSCVVQGVLPYGAQLLMAGALAAISPLKIIGYLYYPMAVLVCALIAIAIKRKPKE